MTRSSGKNSCRPSRSEHDDLDEAQDAIAGWSGYLSELLLLAFDDQEARRRKSLTRYSSWLAESVV